jgi:rubrerythrin
MADARIPDPLFSEPADGDKIGDEGLLTILESAIADERSAQEQYRRGSDRCADREACAMFAQLLRDEEAHERVLSRRYAEVKGRITPGDHRQAK